MASGTKAISGPDQICRQKVIEMNPMAMPASVDKSAARGVPWRTRSATRPLNGARSSQSTVRVSTAFASAAAFDISALDTSSSLRPTALYSANSRLV